MTVTVSEEEGEETVIEVDPLESVEEETETEGVEMLTLAGADSYDGEALMITGALGTGIATSIAGAAAVSGIVVVTTTPAGALATIVVSPAGATVAATLAPSATAAVIAEVPSGDVAMVVIAASGSVTNT